MWSNESRRHQSIVMKRYFRYNFNARNEIRVRMIGRYHQDKNPNWNGGTSFHPYCPAFNEAFKKEIRENFNCECYLCRLSETKNIDQYKRRLSVHHIHYDKQSGCNGTKAECVPLCTSHHAMTSNIRERDWWIAYFEQKLWNIYGWRLETNGEW